VHIWWLIRWLLPNIQWKKSIYDYISLSGVDEYSDDMSSISDQDTLSLYDSEDIEPDLIDESDNYTEVNTVSTGQCIVV
jgi:hypothetical protein